MRSTSKALFILTFLVMSLAIAPGSSFAQNRSEWESFSALNGVQDLAYDSSGTLWIATTGGVVGYRKGDDSYEILRNTEGLARLDASAIGINPSTGDLYIGSSDGSISIRKKSGDWIYSMEIQADAVHSNKRINGFRFRGDRVYILTEFGVALYNATANNFIESYLSFGSPPAGASVYDLVFWQDSIWLATSAGVASAPVDARNLPFPPAWKLRPIGTDTVLSLAVVDGAMTAGSQTGAFTLKGDGTFAARPDLPRGRMLLTSSGGSVAAASGSTLYRFDGSSFSPVTNGPENISAITIDAGGKVVVGFPAHGFGMVAADTFQIRIPNAPSSNTFKDLVLAGDGSVWVAGGLGSVSRLLDGVWSPFTQDNVKDLGTTDVWNIGAGVGSSVWAGQFGAGFMYFAPDDHNNVVTRRYDASNSPIRGQSCGTGFPIGARSATDLNGRTWLVCFYPDKNCQVMMVKLRDDEQSNDGSGFESYLIPSSLNKARVFRWMTIDQNGTKWLGADASDFEHPGLLYFNDRGTPSSQGDDIWGVINTDNGLPDNQQTALAVDADNEIWIGTPKGLAALSNPYGVVMQNLAPSLRTIRIIGDLAVHAIAVDALNQKWVGTDEGIFVLSADGTELVNRFTTATSPLVSDHILSILAVNATGDIYIGTDNGMSKISTPAVESSSSSTLSVSPQPFVVPASEPLRIIGLPTGASVKILSVSGSLVKEFDSPGGSVAFWDGRDQHGTDVPSGVYIIAGSDKLGDTTVLGKVAVIHR